MVGIDIDIERIRQHFESNLWTDKNCEFYGRVYPNMKGKGNEVIPEVYDTDINDYKEVLLDDKLDCISFFYVDPNRGLEFANVSIIFAVNVKNLYSDYDTRETERAMRDARLELNRSGVAFDIENNGIITGIDAIDEFAFKNQNKMDMHPFYLFRFECESNYDFNAPCDYQSSQYLLTISSDDETQGLTLPAIGAHVYKSGQKQTLYPVPKSGYEWAGTWLINGVENTTENPIINFDGNYVAKAFFSAIATAFFKIFTNGVELVDDAYQYTDSIGGLYAKINTPVLSLDGNGADVDTLVKIQGKTLIDLEHHFYIDSLSTSIQRLMSCGANGVNDAGFNMYLVTGNPLIYFSIRDGLGGSMLLFFQGSLNIGKNIINVNWGGNIGEDIVYTLNGVSKTTIAEIEWVGDSFTNLYIGSRGSINYFKGLVAYTKLTNYFKLYYQEGEGVNLYDALGNTTAVLNGAIETEAWANTEQSIRPVLLLDYAYTLFRNNTTLKYLPVIYANGAPQLTEKTGYTKIAEVPVGFGFTAGNYTLNFEETARLLNFGINNNIDFTEAQSFDDILNYMTGVSIVREGSQTTITNLEFKE